MGKYMTNFKIGDKTARWLRLEAAKQDCNRDTIIARALRHYHRSRMDIDPTTPQIEPEDD